MSKYTDNQERLIRLEEERVRRDDDLLRIQDPKAHAELHTPVFQGIFGTMSIMVMTYVVIALAWIIGWSFLFNLVLFLGNIVLFFSYFIYLYQTKKERDEDTRVRTIIFTILTVLSMILLIIYFVIPKFDFLENTPPVEPAVPQVEGLVIATDGVEMRSAARGNGSVLIESIPLGEELVILTRREEWVKVVVDSTEGWCRAEDGTEILILTEPERVRILNENGLNFRAEPSLNAKIIDHLEPKTVCGVLDREEQWFKVKVNGEVGWVKIFSSSGSRYLDEIY
ncbi:SH3 domain-containing protein [bacterium]|nr:SH3 domain-containing protein [bacterium]